MIYRGFRNLCRSAAFTATTALAAIGCGGGGGGDSSEQKPTNPHPTLFSKVTDNETGLSAGDFPIMYGFYANNTNNTTGYAEMATIHRALAPYERVSGFKVEGDKLHLMVEVSDPTKAKGFRDDNTNGALDYVGVTDTSNGSGIKDFDGMRRYANEDLTPQQAFEHAGFFFNTTSLPTSLDLSNPPTRISITFDPNNPANQSVVRVNYGTTQRPVQLSLPTGTADVDLFIEGQTRDRAIDFDPLPADRLALEDFQRQLFYDPTQFKVVVWTDKRTRYTVDRELFFR